MVLLASIRVQAQFNFTTNNGAITITGYTDTNPVVIIPGSTNGYPVTVIGANVFYNSTITSVTIPDSVVSIGSAVFGFCNRLTSVAIPGNVTNISDRPFLGCSGLTNIIVNATNPSYTSAGGVLFNKLLTSLIQYPGGLAGSYTIPASVTNIGLEAFALCSGLTSVAISSGVTNINSAFYNCSSLTNVTIPSSVSAFNGYDFAYCVNLHKVIFPGNAPLVEGRPGSADSTVFYGETGTVYCPLEATGWSSSFGGWPTATYKLPPPTVALSTYSNLPTLFFPTATGTNYVLQMTTNLAASNWVTVTITNGYSVSGFVITNPPPNAFFRLY